MKKYGEDVDVRPMNGGVNFVVDRSAKSFRRSLVKFPAAIRRLVEQRLARLVERGLLPGDQIEKPWGWEAYGIMILRLSRDLRLVFVRDGNCLRLFHLGHHDDAYRFAARHRKILGAAG